MDCAIRTDDAMVSRHHARVCWTAAGYVLEDLSSANGVYFQEQRVQSHAFKHGDAVRCGSLWLRFVDAGAGAAPGPIAPAPSGQTPMMQHPGMGAAGAANPTGHVGAVTPTGLPLTPLTGSPMANTGSGMGSGGIAPGMAALAPGPSESDVEIRVLRRRLEQLQTELRVYRSNKFNPETAQRMEDLESDLSMVEIERDNLKARLERSEQQMATEGGSVKVKRALEIASATAEASAGLNDLLSSVRIEVMAAEGEFDQYAHSIPRASYELIRQSLRDAAGRCDEAREMLRKLREVG